MLRPQRLRRTILNGTYPNKEISRSTDLSLPLRCDAKQRRLAMKMIIVIIKDNEADALDACPDQ